MSSRVARSRPNVYPVAAFVVTLLLVSVPAVADPGDPAINSVGIDYAALSLNVSGNNLLGFDSAGVASATLGSTPLSVKSSSATSVTAGFASVPAPGSYLLTLLYLKKNGTLDTNPNHETTFIVTVADASLVQQVANQGQQIAGLGGQLSAFGQQISNQGQQLSTLGQQISNLQQQLGGLSQQVMNLQNAVGPTHLTVDCAAGQTVGNALAQVANRPGRAVIVIKGVCTESVNVSRTNTFLSGAEPGDGIRAPTSNDVPLSIHAASVGLTQLSLTGGHIGLAINSGANVSVNQCQVTGNTFHGIFITQASASIQGSIISNNGGSGVFVWIGGSATLNNTVIQNSGSRGLELQFNSVAQVDSASQIVNNQQGVGLWYSSVLDLHGTVASNTGNGVGAFGGSFVGIEPTAVIQMNTTNGLQLSDTSVSGFPGSGMAQIVNNGGWGVLCGAPPAVSQVGGNTSFVNIAGNTAGQMNCPLSH